MRTLKDTCIFDVEEVMELEHRIETAGIPMVDLMRKAGAAVARAVTEKLANSTGFDCEVQLENADVQRGNPSAKQKVVVFAGGGNNGGDGWVVADLLAREGFSVELVTSMKASEIKAEPACSEAMRVSEAVRMGTSGCIAIHVTPTAEEVFILLQGAAVVVDALLGIGFKGENVREPVASWINEINNTTVRATGLGTVMNAPYIIAVDVPSGLNAQTGTVATACVKAHKTVTMLACKPGLLLSSARPYVGNLVCDELDIPIKDYWLSG